MRKGISGIGRTAGAIAVAAGVAAGSVTLGGGVANADAFPGGPWCATPTVVKAESNLSRVLICRQVGDSTHYEYHGKARTNGNFVVIPNAFYADGGYNAYNNGYAYHVRPDALVIVAPSGAVISYEPWTYYVSY